MPFLWDAVNTGRRVRHGRAGASGSVLGTDGSDKGADLGATFARASESYQRVRPDYPTALIGTVSEITWGSWRRPAAGDRLPDRQGDPAVCTAEISNHLHRVWVELLLPPLPAWAGPIRCRHSALRPQRRDANGQRAVIGAARAICRPAPGGDRGAPLSRLGVERPGIPHPSAHDPR